MKTKLIKLTETHYIVVDDSEIREDDYFYVVTKNICDGNIISKSLGKGKSCWSEHILSKETDEKGYHPSHCKKITHSTQPLEQYYGATDGTIPFVYHKIKPLSISEVEELVNGYSVDVLFEEELKKETPQIYDEQLLAATKHGFKCGFNTHKELVKDKFFSVEQAKKIFIAGGKLARDINNPSFEEFIQSLLPPTEQCQYE